MRQVFQSSGLMSKWLTSRKCVSRRRRSFLGKFEVLEARLPLAVTTLFAFNDGLATDTLLDGSFADLSYVDLNPISVGGPSLAARRMVMEFNTSAFDVAQQFNSVVLQFTATGGSVTDPSVVQVYAFAGNGNVDSVDAATSEYLVGQIGGVVPTLSSPYVVPLNTSVIRNLAGQNNYLGLQFRLTSGGGISLPSSRSTWSAEYQIKLLFDVEGQAPPGLSVGPAPGSGLWTVENATSPLSIRVTRIATDTSLPLEVQLTSTDTSELTTPSTITIPAGAAAATFSALAVDDRLLDGTQFPAVRATAVGFRDGAVSVNVYDHEVLSLTFSPSTVPETAGVAAAVGTVSRNVDVAANLPLTVALRNLSPSKLAVPAAVTIPAGMMEATFNVDILDNDTVDGSDGLIEISATGYVSTTGGLTIIDDETGKLRPGNILTVGDTRYVYERRADGLLVQTFSTPSGYAQDSIRDVVADNRGNIHVLQTSNYQLYRRGVLTTINVASRATTERIFPDWSIENNIYAGKLATWGDYVFANDWDSIYENSKGIIRWNMADGFSATRFSTSSYVYGMTVGPDGLLYVSEGGGVNAYDPTTMAKVRSLSFLNGVGQFSLDGEGNFYTTSGNAFIKYNSNGKMVRYLLTEHGLRDISVASDGRVVAVSIPANSTQPTFVVVTDRSLGTYTKFQITTSTSLGIGIVDPVHVSAPQLSVSSSIASFTEGGVAIIAPELSLVDDRTVIRGGAATIENLSTGDTLFYLGGVPGISASGFNASTGTLKLSGTATPAVYQEALRRIRFQSTAGNDELTPGLRTIRFEAFDHGWIGSTTKTLRVETTNDAPPVVLSETYTISEDGVLNVAPTETTRLSTTSDPGEWVGGGQSQTETIGYINNNSRGEVQLFYGTSWTLRFSPNFGETFAPGIWNPATSGDNGSAYMQITGNGHQNNASLGYFDVKQLERASDGTLLRFAADFVQHGFTLPALRGTVQYRATHNNKSGLLANDTDIDRSRLTISSFSQPNNGTVVVNPDGSFTYRPAKDFYGTDRFFYTVSDGEGGFTQGTATVNVSPVREAVVVDRSIFYHRSSGTIFGDGSGNPINAVDPSKQALLPGQTPTFSNVTNYVHGLNGLVVDIDGPASVYTISDFRFDVWNGINFQGFVPTVAAPAVTTFTGQGKNGANRVKIEFPNGSVVNTWLRIMVLANANTDLLNNDVFYFGNAVAEMNVGNTAGPPLVLRTNATDTATVRQNQSPTQNSVPISNIYDLNKDGRVNATDTALVRQNQTPNGSMAFFTAPLSLQVANSVFLPGDREASASDGASPVSVGSIEAFFVEFGQESMGKRQRSVARSTPGRYPV